MHRKISNGIFLLMMFVGLGLCGCVSQNSSNSHNTETISASTKSEEQDIKQEYPKIAYIENVNYYGTDKKCEAIPRKAPSGTIETFVDQEIMPDAYNSANFGEEQEKLEYMFLEDGRLIIHLGEDWYYFEKQE